MALQSFQITKVAEKRVYSISETYSYLQTSFGYYSAWCDYSNSNNAETDEVRSNIHSRTEIWHAEVHL